MDTVLRDLQFSLRSLRKDRAALWLSLLALAAVDFPPFGGIDTDFEIPGKTHTESWKGQMGFCDPEFFPTIGMRLLRGHLFTAADVASKRKVAVINQQLARKFFAGADPVGKTI